MKIKLVDVLFYQIVCTLAIFSVVTEAERALLASVTPLTGSENYYIAMNVARRVESRPMERQRKQKLSIPLSQRIRICTAIMGSDFFYMRDIEAADPNEAAIRTGLARNRPDRYNRLYRWENSSQEYRFVSPFEDYTVHVGSHMVEERVFSCLGRERASGNIVEYFISEKYDGFRELPVRDQPADKIKGYFVFSRKDENGDERLRFLEVIALAEKPCEEMRDMDDRWRVTDRDISINTMDHIICNLTSFENVRLCALIFGAKRYRNRYRFLPAEENVDPECIIEDTPVYTPCCSQTLESDDIRMWYIKCKVQTISTGNENKFLIARGAALHSFHVCRERPCVDLTVGDLFKRKT